MKHFLFLFLFSKCLAAPLQQKGSYTIYLNTSEGSVKADVVYENKKITVKENLTYYWYASNKIMETKGGYDGRILDGNYTSFYLNDNLHEKGNFSNGLKDGQWTLWYENGKIKEISHWKSGLKNGITKRFDIRGNLLLVTHHKKGLLNGTEITYAADTIQATRKFVHGKEKSTAINRKEKKTETDSLHQDHVTLLSKLKKKKDAREPKPGNTEQLRKESKNQKPQKADQVSEPANKKPGLQQKLKLLFHKKKKNETESKNENPKK